MTTQDLGAPSPFFYTYFNQATGQILASGLSYDVEAARPDQNAGLLMNVAGTVTTQYVKNGEVVDLPARPSMAHRWDWESGAWELDAAALNAYKAQGKGAIDIAAGQARGRYITTAPGQDATYAVKYAEAKAYRDAGYPPDLTAYPYITGESSPNAPRTAQEAADRIISLGDSWSGVIGPAIEATRINGKDALDDILNVDAITLHVMTVVAALDAI